MTGELAGEAVALTPARHGHRSGGRWSPTYQTWKNIQRRCYDPKHKTYEGYGGRGVRVYFDWLGAGGFAAFLRDVGERPSRGHHLDRIDPAKGYEPGNVRWRPAAENLATSVSCCAKQVEAKGPDGVVRELSLGAWAELLGIKYRTLSRRLQRGMKERAFAQRGRR